MQITGWTIDALAEEWNVDRGYVWRLVNDEKPWSLDRVLSLPDDLEAKVEELRAERFGYIVVKPLTGLDAQKAAVAGLIGLMAAPQLPEKADRMAVATLKCRPAKAAI